MIVSSSRYFVKQNEEDSDKIEYELGQTPLINSAFYKCDRQTTCTHVVKFQETNNCAIIFGHDQLAGTKEMVSVWKKEAGKAILVWLLTSFW